MERKFCITEIKYFNKITNKTYVGLEIDFIS